MHIEDFLYCIAKEIGDSKVFAVKGDYALITQTSMKDICVGRVTNSLDLQILDIDKWTDMIDCFDNISKHSKLKVTYRIRMIKVMCNKVRYYIECSDSERFYVNAYNNPKTYAYEVINVQGRRINFFSPSILLADKLVSCKKDIDLYDIYSLSLAFEFKLSKLIKRIKSKYDIQLYDLINFEELEFEATPKPDFDEVCKQVKYFTYPIFKALKSGNVNRLYWNKKEWVTKDEFMRDNFRAGLPSINQQPHVV